MTTATVGSRYQVVIPRRERDTIGIKPNTKVYVEARDRCVVLYPVSDLTARGIGRDLADGTDATDYVRRLRADWDRRP